MSQITFVEMGSGDAAKTSAFFSELFGWRFEQMGEPADGGWFDAPGIRLGLHGGDPNWGMVPYFNVPDIDRAIETVRALGGSTDGKIADVDGFGRFCNCKDPQGMRFGLHQLESQAAR
ncbi:MAG: VOC family protein [Pseudomonadota bacterium]